MSFKQKNISGYDLQKSSFEIKERHSNMLRGGVILDITTPEQAKIAEDAGAIAVTVSEKRLEESALFSGKMTSPHLVQQVQEEVSIPVIAKCRLGHTVEGQILEALFVDFIDESEELSPVDSKCCIDKHSFRIPFICSARRLSEALKRVSEGASSIKVVGDQKTYDISEVVKNLRKIRKQIHALFSLDISELRHAASSMGVSYELLFSVAKNGKLPVPLFASGGACSPADAALLMRLGAESIFVGPEIFDAEDPIMHAKAIVGGVTYYNDPEILAKVALGYFNEVTGSEMRVLAKEEELLK